MLDNYSIQLKGGAAVAREGTDDDRAIAERYRVAYGEQLYMAGFPRCPTPRINVWREEDYDPLMAHVRSALENEGRSASNSSHANSAK